MSINDIVSDPSLLSEDVQLEIIGKYNDISPDSAFLYLRDYFIKYKNLTVIVMQDGSFAFGSVKSMQSLLKTKDVVITKDTAIGDIIKKSHLVGMLGDIKLVFTKELAQSAAYSAYKHIPNEGNNQPVAVLDNTIYVSEELLADQDYLKFAILHEFQHAVQFLE